MPPASRGVLIRTRHFRPRIQPCSRRNISIEKPRDSRNFPTQAKARSRMRANNGEDVPKEIPNLAKETKEYKLMDKIYKRWRNIKNIFTLPAPQWLKDRPYIRTGLYSFFITVPITGFVLMHLPLERHRVLGPSMKPTLNPGCDSEHDINYDPTYVLVQMYNPNLRREKERSFKEGWLGTYNRGDIVLYTTPHDPEKFAVKRVVGVPGDTVVPMAGYDGGADPVTVQYYQLWIEGDVNDRNKSLDSNYFGPISEALVRGKIIGMWSPWWNIFGARRPNRTKDDWPAKRQKRVAEGAVYEASVNPDKLSYIELFNAEKGESFLRKLQQTPDYMKELFEKDDHFKRTIRYYRDHGLKIAKDNSDPEVRDRAGRIVNELEQIFGAKVLDNLKNKKLEKQRERWTPQKGYENNLEIKAVPVYSESVTHSNELLAAREARVAEKEAQREAQETPAKAALKEMVKQTRQVAELKNKEMEEKKQREV